MKRISALICTAAIALAAASCSRGDIYVPDYSYVFRVENKTDQAVMMFVPEHGNIDCDYVTGDLPKTLTEGLRKTFIKLEPHGYANFYHTNYETEVVSPISGYHPQDKVSFYFFDLKVLDENDWATIVEQKLYLARYDYLPDDVIAMGKVVTYPAKELE